MSGCSVLLWGLPPSERIRLMKSRTVMNSQQKQLCQLNCILKIGNLITVVFKHLPRLSDSEFMKMTDINEHLHRSVHI